MAIWISFLSGTSNYWVGCRLAISLWIKPLRWSASLQPDWWQCKRRQRLLRLCTIRGAIRGWALGVCIKVATSFVRGMIGSIMVCGVIAPRLVCGITALVDLFGISQFLCSHACVVALVAPIGLKLVLIDSPFVEFNMSVPIEIHLQSYACQIC